MNLKELVKHIAEKEGGKSNVKIGDIREILSILSDIFYLEVKKGEWETVDNLLSNGKRRFTKKIKK